MTKPKRLAKVRLVPFAVDPGFVWVRTNDDRTLGYMRRVGDGWVAKPLASGVAESARGPQLLAIAYLIRIDKESRK